MGREEKILDFAFWFGFRHFSYKFSGMTVTIPPQVIPVDQYKYLRLRILFRSRRKMAKGAVI